MKVLFAVNSESISDSIVKAYQKQYKEIISYKNVYYFNAILKELQRDRTYDRIIISEDLEPFANNNYEAIDKFIFEKLDSISDEATNGGGDTPIILICTDRRSKSESILIKLFGIGIYNALLGRDRTVEQICGLLNKPRSKKEAKQYYKIDSEDVGYQAESEDSVSEIEIQNILTHYKRLGKNTERYVDSFNNIAAQYTDAQLRIISKFLPLNVKAVLEADSPKYQSIMTFSDPVYSNKEAVKKQEKEESNLKIGFIENSNTKNRLTKPVIVPSVVDTNKVKKLSKKIEKYNKENMQDKLSSSIEDNTRENVQEASKKRGRPKKNPVEETETFEDETKPKRRGRPKKINYEEPEQDINLFELDEQKPEEETVNLFELDEINEPNNINDSVEEDMAILPGIDEEEKIDNIQTSKNQFDIPEKEETVHVSPANAYQSQYNSNFNNLLTKDKKVVSFVGTTKNGTSFIVNNLAQLFSNMGIKTAILDATKNKNSYYIYTKNEEQLREIAFKCFENLKSGITQGIQVNKNLTVYTSLPDDDSQMEDVDSILTTLVQNYALVLIDTDYGTPLGYFENSQEIYLVQSMDILTIQPLTAFLRDLKSKNIISNPEKLRIVLNKEVRMRGINAKTIIGGMAFYNDPAMSFMTELFNKDNIKYSVIPFDEQVYIRYLEGLVDCNITLNGYSKMMISSLKELANMVYPMISNKYKPQKKNKFSSNMNDTLEKMKNY